VRFGHDVLGFFLLVARFTRRVFGARYVARRPGVTPEDLVVFFFDCCRAITVKRLRRNNFGARRIAQRLGALFFLLLVVRIFVTASLVLVHDMLHEAWEPCILFGLLPCDYRLRRNDLGARSVAHKTGSQF